MTVLQNIGGSSICGTDELNASTEKNPYVRVLCDEQTLICAQCPDATAVLENEKWNNRFRCWVDCGSFGIVVFDCTADTVCPTERIWMVALCYS